MNTKTGNAPFGEKGKKSNFISEVTGLILYTPS